MKKTNYVLILIYFLFVSLSGFGCNSDNIKTENYVVDSTKVDPAHTDIKLGISYQPPASWLPVQRDISSKMIQKDEADSIRTLFNFSLSTVYMDSVSKSMLFTAIVKINDAEIDMDDALELYQQDITSKFSPDDIQVDKFDKDGIIMTRYKIQRPGMSAIKIFFANNNREIVQFDYSLRASYADQLKGAVESSIASIKIVE